MPTTGVDTGRAPATKRQKRGHQPSHSSKLDSNVIKSTDSNAARVGPVEVSAQCRQVRQSRVQVYQLLLARATSFRSPLQDFLY